MITFLVNSSILPGVAEAKGQAGDLASDAIPGEDPLRVVTCPDFRIPASAPGFSE